MKKMIELKAKMNNLNKELNDRNQMVADKMANDIATYGVPLGNKGLTDKVKATKRKITQCQKQIDKLQLKINSGNVVKHKLTPRESKVLNAIRHGTPIANTTTNNSGAAFFDFTDTYKAGQAGFAVLDIRVNGIYKGIIEINEMVANEETIYL